MHEHKQVTIHAHEIEDLLGLIQMRFGEVPKNVREQIMAIDDLNVLDRLFLVAVNAANWDVFVNELNAGKYSFKIVGDGFNPLADDTNKQ